MHGPYCREIFAENAAGNCQCKVMAAAGECMRTGIEAVKMTLKDPYEPILMDLKMPLMRGGYKLLWKLKIKMHIYPLLHKRLIRSLEKARGPKQRPERKRIGQSPYFRKTCSARCSRCSKTAEQIFKIRISMITQNRSCAFRQNSGI